MLLPESQKWDYAIGMVKVDGLEPTDEMKELIAKEKNGEITMADVEKALDIRYKMKKEKA